MLSILVVAFALAMPHAFKSPYYIHLMTLALIWIVLAQGQNLTQGFVGYVSIAQAGFMMLCLYGLGDGAREGMVLYAASYSLATIAIFSVLTRMNDYTIEGFNGLAKKDPWIAGILAVCLLSLAGIPLTAGFLAKFYMLQAALSAKYGLVVVVIAVLMAAVSVYYYFRVLQAMYFRAAEEGAQFPAFSTGFKRVLTLIAILILVLGIQPGLLLHYLYF